MYNFPCHKNMQMTRILYIYMFLPYVIIYQGYLNGFFLSFLKNKHILTSFFTEPGWLTGSLNGSMLFEKGMILGHSVCKFQLQLIVQPKPQTFNRTQHCYFRCDFTRALREERWTCLPSKILHPSKEHLDSLLKSVLDIVWRPIINGIPTWYRQSGLFA